MSVQACAEIVQRADPDRFLAAMSAPPEARARLFPLFAFNVEVSRAPYVTAEPLIAEMRLQWWRDAVAEMASGGAVRSHEVATPLAEVVREHGLPTDLMTRMIDARRWDIAGEDFADPAALEDYLRASGGALMTLSVGALGRRDLGLPAEEAGFAGAAAAWLCAVPELAARGRAALPVENEVAIQTLAETGLAALARARRAEFGAAAPALRSAWLAGPILRRALARPELVRAGGLRPSDFSAKLSLMWRSLRGGW